MSRQEIERNKIYKKSARKLFNQKQANGNPQLKSDR
jgi:hypothetical protein